MSNSNHENRTQIRGKKESTVDAQGRYIYLAKNTVLFAISSFGSKLMTFLMVPLYTSVLSTSNYGTADIINTTATLCIYVLTIDISNSVTRFAIDDRKKSDDVICYGLKVLWIGTMVMIVGTVGIWWSGLIKWENYCYILLIAIFFFQALEGICSGYLRATDRVQVMVTASLISTGMRLASNVITLIFLKWGVAGYLISMAAGPVVSCLYALSYILPVRKAVSDAEEVLKLHREMRKYAYCSAVNSVGWWVANSVDRYFLVWMKGSAVNGIYSVAYKIPSIMSVLCGIFSQAWGLSAIREYDRGSQTDQSSFFSTMYRLLSAGIMVSCSVLIFCNVGIAKLLFAKDFFEAWRYSSMLLLATSLNGMCTFFGGIFTAAKHNSELAITMVVSMVVNIILNILLIPYYSAMGAAIATVISYYVIWLMRYLMSRKYLKCNIDLRRDHFAVIIIITQIIMEHKDNHLYLGQAVTVLTMVFLYRREVVQCYKKCVIFLRKLMSKYKRN